jgi:hypothetical protein
MFTGKLPNVIARWLNFGHIFYLKTNLMIKYVLQQSVIYIIRYQYFSFLAEKSCLDIAGH